MSADSELAAAGVTDPELRASYRSCRSLAARHGRTYFLATRLLPPAKRPPVHALYALARTADDIVDDAVGIPPSVVERRLRELSDGLRDRGPDHAVLPAVRDTIARYPIDPALVDAFFDSMRLDLTVTGYAEFADLRRYTLGSAEVIGLQLLPVLGTAPGLADAAAPYARDLGTAFQLTNFIRDVGEDLDRGRLYLPTADLALFGLTRADLATRIVDGRVRRLFAFEIARAREFYRSAAPGIRLLDPDSRDCVQTALTLYSGILDAIEAADYRVFDRRVSVGVPRRLWVFGAGLLRARRSRRPHHTHHVTV